MNFSVTNYSDRIDDLCWLQGANPETETFTKEICDLDEYLLFSLLKKQGSLGKNCPVSGTLTAFPGKKAGKHHWQM